MLLTQHAHGLLQLRMAGRFALPDAAVQPGKARVQFAELDGEDFMPMVPPPFCILLYGAGLPPAMCSFAAVYRQKEPKCKQT